MKKFLEVETKTGMVAINPEHILTLAKNPIDNTTVIQCRDDMIVSSTQSYDVVMNILTRILMK